MDILHDICMENAADATVGGKEIFVCRRTLKSQNRIKKLQPTIIYATLNVNLCTIILSWYRPVINRISNPSTTSYFHLRDIFRTNILKYW